MTDRTEATIIIGENVTTSNSSKSLNWILAIGHKPNTDLFKPWLDTDEVGYLKKIDGTPRTQLPGIFVAGDCADPVYRQAITAAGTGCQAAIEAERFLLEG